MKKPLRLIAALLAVCMLAAMLPPVGLAAGGTVHTITGTDDPEAFINSNQVSDGDTIRIATPTATIQRGGEYPWVINKSVIIEGTSKDANILIHRTGILLGAKVTFRNVGLDLTMNSRNAIIANGYELTLEDVRCTNVSFNLFCGGLIDSNNEGFSIPPAGSTGILNISGSTTLQGKDTWGSGNIYAGNLSMGGMLPETSSLNAPPNVFNGDAVINISGSAGSTALGNIYACGAQNKNPESDIPGQLPLATKRTYPNPNAYKVSGTVTITGTNALPSVNGAGSAETDVVYKGNENEFKIAFTDLSSLTVESGKLVPMADSYLRNNGTLTLQSGAKLDLRETDGMTLNVFDYQGNDGFVFLNQDQTWWIQGQVTGTTKVAIGGTTYDDTGSQKIPTVGQVYITAPHSQDGNFDLLPYASSLLTLVRDDNGNWTASDSSSGESINRVTSFQITLDEVSITMAEDAEIEMEASFETLDLPVLDFIPLTISVNGGADLFAAEDQESGYYTYRYQNGVLEMTVIDNALCITPDRQYSADTYKIRVTIPPKYNGAGQTLTDSVTLIVTNGDTPSIPGPVSVSVPTANTGLKWTGVVQTGVDEGTGYTLSGHKGTAVGNYTATATLEQNYQWNDGTTNPKTINWSIARADGPAAPIGLVGIAPSAAGGSDGKITGTDAGMEYASNATFTNAQTCGNPETTGLSAGTYHVRVKETATHEPGAYTTITVSEQPGNPEHAHIWSSAWKNNTTHHWHDCTVSDCPIIDNGQKNGYDVHTAGNWVVDRPATSTQNGIRHRSCTACGYEMAREPIPSTGGSSSGGSSSGGSSSTTSVKNPDGSTTSTTTNKTTGTVTETTKRPDGSKTVVETQKDGTVTTTDTAKDGSTVKTVARPNGTTETTVKQANGLTASVQENRYSAEAVVRIPSGVTEKNPGSSVILPIPALPGENATVTIYTGVIRPVLVKIPVYGSESTTVATLINSNGSETILKTALLDRGQITVSVPDGAVVHVRDNSKDFQDIQGHWAESAIDFAAARELFAGKTSSTFAPDDSMSRAMLAVVLARLDGADAAGGNVYQQGMSWAVAHGISDGQNPDGQVTREQFVTMLYRYAGSPAVTDRELHFGDVEEISTYARKAIIWATENGILNGYEDGRVVPKGKTTRAQVAAMLTQYVKSLN